MSSTRQSTRRIEAPRVIHHLEERTTPHRPVRTSSARPGRPEPCRASDEAALLAWLATFAQPGRTDVDGHSVPDPTFTQLLGRLTTSKSPLPPDIADSVGISHLDATVGDVATELLVTVNDPAGPRCRSYRAAIYYRQGDPGPLFTL